MRLECEEEGKRLDVFLAESVAGLSRSAAQNLLGAGCGDPQWQTGEEE